MSESATVSFARPITAAAGVYAPGHIGELTQYLPFELVDDVLSETKTVQRRLRDLPSRVGVYFVLALVLFPRLGYARVWQKLTAGLVGLDLPSPSEKALRDLRRRLGPAPFKALFEVVAGPLGQPHTPGVCYRGMRTVAFDGCNSLRVPDTERNRFWLGRIRYRMGFAGYPTLRMMTLIETGTRAMIGAVLGSAADRDEATLARRLLPLLHPNMVVLLDRAFDATAFLHELNADRREVPGAQQVHPPATGADPPPRRVLPVRPRRAAGAHHRRGTDRHRRRRQPGPRPLPADHHPAGPRPPSGGRAGPALPRTLGDRDRLPGAAAHHPRRARAALPGPARSRAGGLGPADRLPAAPDGHGHRRRVTTRHQPRPGQLHHRPAGRPRPAHRSRRDRPPGPASPASPTSSVSSAAPSWPRCCHPADPAGAPAGSRTPPPATSTATTDGRTCRPPSPASTSPCTRPASTRVWRPRSRKPRNPNAAPTRRELITALMEDEPEPTLARPRTRRQARHQAPQHAHPARRMDSPRLPHPHPRRHLQTPDTPRHRQSLTTGPAAKLRGIAARWPPATLDPGHQRARGLAIGSDALSWPVPSAHPHAPPT